MARTKTTSRMDSPPSPARLQTARKEVGRNAEETEGEGTSSRRVQPSRRPGKAPVEPQPEADPSSSEGDESGSDEESSREGSNPPFERFINHVALGRAGKWKKRTFTRTKVLKSDSVDELSCGYVLDYFQSSYLHNLITLDEPTHHELVLQFYANLGADSSNPECTYVNGVLIPVNKFVINEILKCPIKDDSLLRPKNPSGAYEVYASNEWPKVEDAQPLDLVAMGKLYFRIEGDEPGTAEEYDVSQLSLEHRLVFEWICFNVLPSGSRVTEPTIGRLLVFYYLMEKMVINPGYTIVKYMYKCSGMDSKKFPYGSLITILARNKGIVSPDLPVFPEYYDENWFLNKKGLELDEETGKYKFKVETEETIARVAKRKRDASSSRSSGKGKKLLAKLGKIISCFKGQLEAQKAAAVKLREDMDAHIHDNNIEIELSEDEVEPSFGEVPVLSDEEDLGRAIV